MQHGNCVPRWVIRLELNVLLSVSYEMCFPSGSGVWCSPIEKVAGAQGGHSFVKDGDQRRG